MDNKKHTLIINGQKTLVSEEIYQAYKQGKRKERYMAKDLKANKFVIDGESVIEIPSREDSYDRLLELDRQFPDTKEPLPEDAISRMEMLQALERHYIPCQMTTCFSWKNYFTMSARNAKSPE